MGNIGLKTEAKSCHKCHWCGKYDDYDIIANTHTPVYYCHFPGGNWKRDEQEPTLDKNCPYFNERYVEDEEEE